MRATSPVAGATRLNSSQDNNVIVFQDHHTAQEWASDNFTDKLMRKQREQKLGLDKKFVDIDATAEPEIDANNLDSSATLQGSQNKGQSPIVKLLKKKLEQRPKTIPGLTDVVDALMLDRSSQDPLSNAESSQDEIKEHSAGSSGINSSRELLFGKPRLTKND